MEKQRTLIDLPFEVLDLILGELKNLTDKLHLAQAHEYLGKAFAYHSRLEYKIFQPFSATFELFVVIVKECGSTIEELSNYYMNSPHWNDELAKSIEKYCPNLKTVKLHVFGDNCEGVQIFLKNISKSLTSVELNIRPFVDPKKIFEAVAEMSNLKRLTCVNYTFDEVCQIQKLIALEELVIDSANPYHPPPINLLEICAPLINLRRLTARFIAIMPSEMPHSMIWPEVESLSLNSCEIFTNFPDCPKLKTLDIAYTNSHVEGFLFGFILQNGQNIEKINEKVKPPPFDGESFLQVLRSCPKLQAFYTPMQDIKIYQAYVSSLIATLKDIGVTSEEPFRLIIYSRGKFKWIHRLIPRTSHPELIALDYLHRY
ncbi:uncharacterized protein LOC108108416 [Drosophila eugracilis]|uniref:uncharacterized protein LOC108108416 n=1 Tax=Drosophila eugracilis TaxID=29029 RepID=UPI0007E7A889|nr:uncharacterized protein LOC108108416 [Drosophila eugracilis]